MVVPRLLQCATARQWVECQRWTPKHLSSCLAGQLLTVKSNARSPLFMYSEHLAPRTRRQRVLQDNVNDATDMHEMDGGRFFERLGASRLSTQPHLYYTAPLSRELLASLNGWETVTHHDGRLPVDAPPCQPSLWAGTPGATTQLHYDVLHNTFVQLHGTKRFTCLAPSHAEGISFYPDTHPRARKAQTHINLQNQLTSKEALRFDLHPGDVLFVPAFWLHHVEAVSSSVSVNVFSEAHERLVAAQVFGQPAPLDPEWPTDFLLEHAIPGAVDTVAQAAGVPAEALVEHIIRRYRDCGEPRHGTDTADIEPSRRVRRRSHAANPVPLAEELGLAWSETRENLQPLFANLIDPGVAFLVAAHLLELWVSKVVPVNLVGATLNHAKPS
eukprot:m.118520 g.118520  ORF g.118520 m.118520 type:complete len:386 (+) comp16434_c0_seq2:2265-3422(+)